MLTNISTDGNPVLFYGPEHYCLSNFSAFRLYWKCLDFDTSEAAYHWEKFAPVADPKATWRGHPTMCVQIHGARSAHDAYKVAQANKHLARPDWDEIRVGVMQEILREKVRQHEYVRRKLLETGDRLLVEDSWRDNFWGWGPDQKGANVLGLLWMTVRNELRERPEDVNVA
jgi:ribA/ribD-fused uncharacterized protein